MSVTEELYRSYPMKDWYELLRRKEDKSFYSDLPFERLVKDLKWEIDELFEWIEKNDKPNIVEEVWDVILNTQQLLQALMKRWLLTVEDLKWTWKAEKEKIYQRQPYLKDWTQLGSWEEETALFKKLKEQKKKETEREHQMEILFNN